MLEPFLVIVLTALLSSALTAFLVWLLLQRLWRRDLEQRLRELHDDIGRTVEMRTRRAVSEAMADSNAADALRDVTWKAARSGSDLLSDGISAIFGRRRRDME